MVSVGFFSDAVVKAPAHLTTKHAPVRRASGKKPFSPLRFAFIGAHAASPVFVNGAAGDVQVASLKRHDFGFGGAQDLFGSIVHFGGHLVFVVADFIFDASDGHAVAVFVRVVHGDAIVGARQNFAIGMQSDQRGVALLDGGLEIDAEAGQSFRESGIGLRAAVPELSAEASQIVALDAAMVEARHIDVFAADAVVVLRGAADQFRQESEHVEADLFAEIAADDVGRIADAVGMRVRFRIEQDASGIDAGGGDDHDAGVQLAFLAGDAVEVLDAVGFAFVVDENSRDDRVVHPLRGLPVRVGRPIQVVREELKKAPTTTASAATCRTWRGGRGVQGLGEDGSAAGDDRDADGFAGFLQETFAASGRCGGGQHVGAAGARES